MSQLINKSFKDLFDKQIILFSLVPILLSILLWGLVFVIFISYIDEFFISIVSYIPFVSNTGVVFSFLKFFFSFFAFYQLVIISSVLFVGIVSESIVNRINIKHYNLEKKGFGSISGSMLVALKSTLVFVLLFILLSPLLFVPMLNLLVTLFLWSILIKKPMFYDALSVHASKEEFKEVRKRLNLFGFSFLAATIFLIPILGAFLYVLQLILFTHLSLSKLQQVRKISPTQNSTLKTKNSK